MSSQADETSEILKIPAQYHSSLIGEKGKYTIRLEDKYSVKITFPRHAGDGGEQKTREQLKSDEVLIRGGRKGVAGAKSELLDAVEYEKETNNTLKFTVPTRSVARILGRGGANINEIKDDTNCSHIDLERGSDEVNSTSTITLRGTKKDIAAAKAAILAIADQVQEEVTESVTIESRYHRSIIGAGGQGLKDLIARCGGPSDPKAQVGLVRFPRQGEYGEEVLLRGEAKVVAKLKEELEKIAAEHRDRVILGVDIPAQQHRALIGRGGQTLNDLQNKFNVQIQFPGSRSYGQVGVPENADELAEVDAANLVKVTGSRSNVEAAIADLKSHIKPPMPEGITREVSVPSKYQFAISSQGSFFRTLRGHGVQVDQSVPTQRSSLPARPPSEQVTSARIDDEEDPASPSAFEWQVVQNYQDVEEGDSVWTLKGRDEAALDKAEKMINDAIQKATKASHVGFLTLADRSSFPRIVGTKGASVARLRDESGADITVSRENNTIVIVGEYPVILPLLSVQFTHAASHRC
jgi:predicted PilT family ATPase